METANNLNEEASELATNQMQTDTRQAEMGSKDSTRNLPSDDLIDAGEAIRMTMERLGVPQSLVVDRESERESLRARIAEEAKRALQGKRERNQAILRDRCPPAYERYVDRDDMFPSETWKRLMGWEGKQSFGLMGVTRAWKTTMAWRMIIDANVPAPSLFVTTGISLARAIQHQWGDDESKAIVRRARDCGVLFVDDWGKDARAGDSKSAAVQEELFDIVDKRLTHDRTLIFTTNLTGEEMKDSLGENFQAAFWRRLRDYCKIIVCQPTKL